MRSETRLFKAKLLLVRETVPCDDVLRWAGIEAKGKKWRCPFHGELDPSFTVYSDGRRYGCFGCGAKGDVIDLTTKLFKVEFKKAVSMLYDGLKHPAWTAERIARLAQRSKHDEDEHTRWICRTLWWCAIKLGRSRQARGSITWPDLDAAYADADRHLDSAAYGEYGAPTGSYFGLLWVIRWALPGRARRPKS